MAKAKEARKTTPRENELNVLDNSRRRCALCFHLHGDLMEKHGQIAHLDDNPANYAEDNLAFLCMAHHSLYDSKTSQHKNYTIAEAKTARDRLYKVIVEGKHLGVSQSVAGLDTDRKTLSDLLELLSPVMEFLRGYNFEWSFHRKSLDGLHRFVKERQGPEHQFVNSELEALRGRLLEDSKSLWSTIAGNTFVEDEDRNSIPSEWEYEQPERFDEAVRSIHDAADKVCSCYDELIQTARKRLSE